MRQGCVLSQQEGVAVPCFDGVVTLGGFRILNITDPGDVCLLLCPCPCRSHEHSAGGAHTVHSFLYPSR